MDYKIKDVDVKNVIANPANPRKEFNADELLELSNSIKSLGILQPLLVQEKDNKFMLITGERRLKAAVMAGLESVPCAILERDMDAATMEQAMIVENNQRVNLSPVEEAEEYEKMATKHKLTPEQIAVQVGRHPYYIYTRMKFLKLAPVVRKGIGITSGFTMQHALELTRIGHKEQEDVIDHFFENNYNNDYPTVKELRQYVEKEYMLNISKAPFITSHEYGKLVTCGKCNERTGAQATLFEENGNNLCLNPSCWAKKKAAETEIKLEKYKAAGKKVHKMESLEENGRANTLASLSDKPDNAKYKAKTSKRYTFKEVLKDVKEIEMIPVLMPDGSIEEFIDKKQVASKIPSKFLDKDTSSSGVSEKPQGAAGRYKRRLEIAKEKAAPIAAAKALRSAAEKLISKMSDKKFHAELAELLEGIIGQGGEKGWIKAFDIERPAKLPQYGTWQSNGKDKHFKEYVKSNPSESLLMVIFMGRCLDYNSTLLKKPGLPILELAGIKYEEVFKREYDKLAAAIPDPNAVKHESVPEEIKKEIKQ